MLNSPTQIRPIIERFAPLWNRLTEPADDIQGQDERRRAQMLSALLLLEAFGILLVLGIQHFLNESLFTFSSPNLLIAFTVVLGMYVLSRTHYSAWVAYLNIILAYLAFLIMFMRQSEQPNLVAAYFLSVVLLASLLLTFWKTILTAVIISLTLVYLAWLLPADVHHLTHSGAIFSLMLTWLISVTAYLQRNYLSKLHDSEERVRHLMDANFEAIVVFTPTDGILDVNPAFERMLGYAQQDILGWQLMHFVTNANSRRLLQNDINNLTQYPLIELEAEHQNGETLHLEVTIQPYRYRGKSAHVAIIHDVTEQRQAEESLRENRMRYKTLFKETSDAVFWISLDGVLLSANPRAEEIFGCEMSEIVGKRVDDFVPEEEQIESKDRLATILNSKSLIVNERTLRRHNGETFPAETHTKLIQDSNGKPQYILSMVRDNSERIQAEAQRLEVSIQRERVGLLQQFISDTSHFFRTPLTSMKTSLYLLRKVGDDASKRGKYYDLIEGELMRLNQLLSDLQLLTTLESDDIPNFSKINMDINVLLGEIIENVRGLKTGSLAYRFQLLPDKERVIVNADRIHLAQAIQNVLHNAITYMPDGGEVTISVNQTDPCVQIIIQDKGVGIPEDELSKVFDHFYRGDKGMTIWNSGNGMGLTVAKKIINVHDGTIEIESIVSEGTTVTINLPMVAHGLSTTQMRKVVVSQET